MTAPGGRLPIRIRTVLRSRCKDLGSSDILRSETTRSISRPNFRTAPRTISARVATAELTISIPRRWIRLDRFLPQYELADFKHFNHSRNLCVFYSAWCAYLGTFTTHKDKYTLCQQCCISTVPAYPAKDGMRYRRCSLPILHHIPKSARSHLCPCSLCLECIRRLLAGLRHHHGRRCNHLHIHIRHQQQCLPFRSSRARSVPFDRLRECR